MIEAVNELIKFIYGLNSYRSDGYEFFFGKSFEREPQSPYKRYNMYLRWMVRDSDIDLGLFKNLPKDKKIIVYCRGRNCAYANLASKLLNDNGFQAYSLNQSYYDWQKNKNF